MIESYQLFWKIISMYKVELVDDIVVLTTANIIVLVLLSLLADLLKWVFGGGDTF